MNTIKVFISCNENIQIRENTDVFITFDDNIYGIHSKRVNILYINNILNEQDTLGRGNICDFMFASLHIISFGYKNGSTLKGNNLLLLE